MTAKTVAAVGAFSMGLAVILGAFGAHALRDQITRDALETYKTGQLYHALASLGLIAVGLLGQAFGVKVKVAGWLLTLGMIIFGGTLYLLAITGIRWLGAITPIGGVLMISAWLILAVQLSSSRRD